MASYGGNLKFILEYTAALDSGNTFRDVDIELIVSYSGECILQVIWVLKDFHSTMILH